MKTHAFLPFLLLSIALIHGCANSRPAVPAAQPAATYNTATYERCSPRLQTRPGVPQAQGDAILACLGNIDHFPPAPRNRTAKQPPLPLAFRAIYTDGTTNAFWFSHDAKRVSRTPGGGFLVPDDRQAPLAQIFASWQAADKALLTSQPLPCQYRVVTGDTLSGIARLFYDDASKWRLIFNANKTILKKPELLRDGMLLTIPKPADKK